MMEKVMRAAVVREFGSVDQVVPDEFPAPVPAADQITVAVRAVPINYVDLLVIGAKYQFLPQLPFIPGKGPAGVVSAVGAAVSSFAIGDRVLAMVEQGGYAEQVVVSPNQCYRLPDAMSFVEAASMSLAYDTAWFALRDRARLRKGETVLILGGSGAVGLAAIQLAKAMGARVLAGISRAEKAAKVLQAGADATIDLSGEGLRETLRERVKAANSGEYADVVLDPLGGDVFDAALRALAWCGRLVVIGFASGRIPTVKVNYLLLKNIEVSGLQVSDYRKRRPEQVATCYAELFAWFEQGKLKPAETTLYPLGRVVEALTSVRDRTATGRPVLVFPQ
jgi:NADPH:quinone reductase